MGDDSGRRKEECRSINTNMTHRTCGGAGAEFECLKSTGSFQSRDVPLKFPNTHEHLKYLLIFNPQTLSSRLLLVLCSQEMTR
jgi:hypothetical protein